MDSQAPKLTFTLTYPHPYLNPHLQHSCHSRCHLALSEDCPQVKESRSQDSRPVMNVGQ